MRRPPPRRRDRVATDRHRARGREELLDAVLAHDELPVGIERALRPWWRDHLAFDLDPEPHPFGVCARAGGTATTGDLLVDGRHDGRTVELEAPPEERLHADEPQRPGAEDPRTSLLVGHGMRRLVGVRQQHAAARQREVHRGHLRGLPRLPRPPRPPRAAGRPGPGRPTPTSTCPPGTSARSASPPSPRRRTRPARRSGRWPCAVPISSGRFSVQYRRDLGVVAGRPGNRGDWPERSWARRLADRPRADARRRRRRSARRHEPSGDRDGRGDPGWRPGCASSTGTRTR